MAPTIEDVILQQDRRGVSRLRPHLPPDYCAQAARYILDHPGDVIVATGFYILMSGTSETDGPPGALAIAHALQALGRRVTLVADPFCGPALRHCVGAETEVADFPIAGLEASRQFAAGLLSKLGPAVLVSIERSGPTRSGAYLNMRDADITPFTARVDFLFEAGLPSVGIGDGGNEIGMGNLAEVIPTVDGLPRDPAVTRVDRLVIASVSNWGGYGLVAALSRLTGTNLLPTVEHERSLVHRLVDLGLVDGTTGEALPKVDGFTTEENGKVLEQLHRLVEERAE